LRVVAASARGPSLDDYAPELRARPWRCEPAPLSIDEESRKLTAVCAYCSQVRAFGGEPAVRAFMRRGHCAVGGEPVWRAD